MARFNSCCQCSSIGDHHMGTRPRFPSERSMPCWFNLVDSSIRKSWSRIDFCPDLHVCYECLDYYFSVVEDQQG